MNKNCEVIRDLLPLYADDACSEESRRLVEGHLAECPDCSGMLQRLKNNEIENGLQMEKQDVIEYGAKKFRKQSATVGSTVSGVLLVPILICLIINLTAGSAMGWFFIVLADGRGGERDRRSDHGAEGLQGALDSGRVYREPDHPAGRYLHGQPRELVLAGIQLRAVRAGGLLPAVCGAGKAAAEMDREEQ